jgi:PAS domain S-box-containing protein
MADVHLSGRERHFDTDALIVSKTDLKGRILYSNRLFADLAGYGERDLIGAPHSIIRHPEMPRAVFRLLWERVAAGREIFAYVVNRSRNGDHYWVFAHVTPSRDVDGRIVGFHSSRRAPRRAALERIMPLYRGLRDIEQGAADRKVGLDASFGALMEKLADDGVGYDEFVFSL